MLRFPSRQGSLGCGETEDLRWLETHAVPLRDAGADIADLLAITRDTTGRKGVEEALQESERLYRAVVEQATENIFLVDVESRRIV